MLVLQDSLAVITLNTRKSMARERRRLNGDLASFEDSEFWPRFEENITRSPHACWLWTGTKTKSGYGVLAHRRVAYYAHRLAWERRYGPIKNFLHVLHRCDAPNCVNPEHLFLGTQRDNNDDKIRKGRARGGSMPGEIHPMAKLTEEQVLEIRGLYKGGYVTQIELGAMYGVSQPAISAIIVGRAWGHI